ncbi:hypothetical protein SAMN05444156_1909 [Verrucomicrobium sp. GAS474]|uniref:hypothetical protein n=1 Tax=Verrucomicrobium sp. GAS474 TaxID=1882831 RepID=UPI00087A11C0|nr:hypothetical protein [Verrucomicrobium sp. GAS474]SDU09202.1 hypothetical protein SAMN05444156_1909 [Verrucomicrobium sp. GAS474]
MSDPFSPTEIPASNSYTLKRVNPIQAGKVVGLTYGALALLFVPFFLLFGIASLFAKQQGAAVAGVGGIALCLFLPVLYAILGFIFGALGAWVYNLVAKWVGGLKFEIEKGA